MILLVSRHRFEPVLGVERSPCENEEKKQQTDHNAPAARFAATIHDSSSGANPRRKQFSVITRATRKLWRYSRPPAFVPPPLILNPPKGWRSTIAPVIGRFI